MGIHDRSWRRRETTSNTPPTTPSAIPKAQLDGYPEHLAQGLNCILDDNSAVADASVIHHSQIFQPRTPTTPSGLSSTIRSRDRSTATSRSQATTLSSNPPASPTPTRRFDGIMAKRTWRSETTRGSQPPNENAYQPSATVQGSMAVVAASESQHLQTIEAEVRQRREQVLKRLGPNALIQFKPSEILQSPRAVSPSRPYLGNLDLPGNGSADIPHSQNCALWIEGLPADVTYHQFLDSIRNVGKVFATVINPPKGLHTTSAAKIVFFDHEAARILHSKIRFGEFKVMGRYVHNVRFNKIRSAAYLSTEHSRAIKITGPSSVIDVGYLEKFFDSRFKYDLDCILEAPSEKPGDKSLIWRFGSLRCQAAWAKLALEREFRGIYQVAWASDPCESP